MYMYIHVYTHA